MTHLAILRYNYVILILYRYSYRRLGDLSSRTGPLYGKHQTTLRGNGSGRALRHAIADELSGLPRSGVASLRSLFPTWSPTTIDFLAQCLRTDSDARPKCVTLLQHSLFLQDGFTDRFLDELKRLVAKESAMNPLATRRTETSSRICRSSIGRLVPCNDELVQHGVKTTWTSVV